jgi:hypothetical protein
MTFTAEQIAHLASKVDERCIPEPNSGCVFWLGPTNSKGYGQINFQGTTVKTHRVAYMRSKGSIAPGLTVDHLCRVTCCVNPAHLEVVTITENVKRSTVGQRMAARTHCNHGHPFAVHGWLKKANGYRRCAECERLRSLAYQRRRRAS